MKRCLVLLACLTAGIAVAEPLPEIEAAGVISAPEQGWPYFFGSCSWYCGAPAIEVAASSFLTEKSGLRHPPLQAHDQSMDQVWSEGADGNGIGESLTFTFTTTEKDTTGLGVTSCAIASGHQGSEKLFRQNARPRVIELSYNGEPVARLRLGDAMGLQRFEIPKLVLERPSRHRIRLKIIEVYPGTHFEDTCIAEVRFQGTGKMH